MGLFHNYIVYLVAIWIAIWISSWSAILQRRSQDFFLGGATRYIFVTSPGADRIQWGGGGSSRNFPWSQLPDRIQWGGVVAEIFRDLSYRIGFSGGEGSIRNFSRWQIKHIPSIPGHFLYIFGPPAALSPFMDTHGNSGTLPMSAYTFNPRNNINSFPKKTFTKSLGGPWPPWPPPWLRHCHPLRCVDLSFQEQSKC